MEPTVKLETITPAIAKELLAKSKGNRTLIERNLTQIATELKNDNWHLTGETIKIDSNGVPRDGFHRLESVIRTGRPIRTFVARGISKEAVHYIDTGRSRTAGDVLSIEGIDNAGMIASMIRFIMHFKAGQFGSAARGGGKENVITNAKISEFAHKNKASLLESMPYGYSKGNRKVLQANMISSLHYIFKQISYDDADDFCHKFALGGNLNQTSPIFAVRKIFELDQINRFNRSKTEKLALICKAWNLYRNDKKVTTTLSFNHLEEEFPKPI